MAHRQQKERRTSNESTFSTASGVMVDDSIIAKSALASIKQLSKLNEKELAKFLKDKPNLFDQLLKIQSKDITKVKARRRGVKRKGRDNDDNLDYENNVTSFYHDVIYPGVMEYLQREQEGTTSLVYKSSKITESPWSSYERSLATLKTGEENRSEFLKQLGKQIQDFEISGTDYQRRSLFEYISAGAHIKAYFDFFLPPGKKETKEINKKRLCADMKINRQRAHYLVACFQFVSKYNLILYSGISLRELIKWRVRLEKFLEKFPDKAAFLMGDIRDNNSFTFDNLLMAYSKENLEQQASVNEEGKEAVQSRKKRRTEEAEMDNPFAAGDYDAEKFDDEDDGDDGDDEQDDGEELDSEDSEDGNDDDELDDDEQEDDLGDVVVQDGDAEMEEREDSVDDLGLGNITISDPPRHITRPKNPPNVIKTRVGNRTVIKKITTKDTPTTSTSTTSGTPTTSSDTPPRKKRGKRGGKREKEKQARREARNVQAVASPATQGIDQVPPTPSDPPTPAKEATVMLTQSLFPKDPTS